MAPCLWVCLTCGEHLQDTPKAIIEDIGQHVCKYKVLKKTNLEVVHALVQQEIDKPTVLTAAAPPPPPNKLGAPIPIVLNESQGSMEDRIRMFKLKKVIPTKEKKQQESHEQQGGLYNELKRVLKKRNERNDQNTVIDLTIDVKRFKGK